MLKVYAVKRWDNVARQIANSMDYAVDALTDSDANLMDIESAYSVAVECCDLLFNCHYITKTTWKEWYSNLINLRNVAWDAIDD